MNNIYHFAMHLFQSIKKGKKEKSRQRAFMGAKKKSSNPAMNICNQTLQLSEAGRICGLNNSFGERNGQIMSENGSFGLLALCDLQT